MSLRRRIRIYYLNINHTTTELISKKVPNLHLVQSIVFHKTSLLHYGSIWTRISRRISFDIRNPRQELLSFLCRRKTVHFECAWIIVISIKSPLRIGIHYHLFQDFLISSVKQRSTLRSTFEELIIWSVSKQATNGRLHSGQDMNTLNTMSCLLVLPMCWQSSNIL